MEIPLRVAYGEPEPTSFIVNELTWSQTIQKQIKLPSKLNAKFPGLKQQYEEQNEHSLQIQKN